jgi:hypothetical protein
MMPGDSEAGRRRSMLLRESHIDRRMINRGADMSIRIVAYSISKHLLIFTGIVQQTRDSSGAKHVANNSAGLRRISSFEPAWRFGYSARNTKNSSGPARTRYEPSPLILMRKALLHWNSLCQEEQHLSVGAQT